MIDKNKNILVTGGLGFIGSHAVVELIEAGYNPVIVDSLENAELFILDRIEEITKVKPIFYHANCCNQNSIDAIFEKENISGVIHFAAYKAVGESVKNPISYFENNISSLWVILKSMMKYNVQNLIFSSSCTVYGTISSFPVDEKMEFGEAYSPYGYTKQVCENLISYHAQSHNNFNVVILRYFNPIGAHPSAKIGELPIGIPDNLIPFITQTAAGIRKELTVFGNDYATKDGSCVRDYIHVCDLAKAHVQALNYKFTKNVNKEIVNLGTGKGNTVLEIIETFERVNNVKVNYTIGKRREGDIPVMYAAVNKAKEILNWEPIFSLEEALKHAWNWQVKLSENTKS